MASLYRLDYVSPERPVRDPVIGGDLLTRHMQTARRRAIEIAAEDGEAILISRIAGSGSMTATLVVEADGRTHRPPGTKPAVPREDCKRHTGATCFCTPCRRERREVRR
jgi:hypothetical protein